MSSARRNDHIQLNLRHLTKRNAIFPKRPLASQSTDPRTSTNTNTNTLRPPPRPTAPPFFEASMPKPRTSNLSPSITNDAWEAAERLLERQPVNPRKQPYGDDAPPRNDSDDDFEPVHITPRPSRPRKRTRTSSEASLRDDRASMTKRSANKSSKRHLLGAPASIHPPTILDYDRTPPRETLYSTSQEEQDDDHQRLVVFDGENSSVSGGDHEERQSELHNHTKRNRVGLGLKNKSHKQASETNLKSPNSRRSRLQSPSSPNHSLRNTSRAQNSQSQQFTNHHNLQRRKSISLSESPAIAGCFQNQLDHKHRDSTHPLVSAPPRSIIEIKQRRKTIRPLCFSESEDSDVDQPEFSCRERRRRSAEQHPVAQVGRMQNCDLKGEHVAEDLDVQNLNQSHGSDLEKSKQIVNIIRLDSKARRSVSPKKVHVAQGKLTGLTRNCRRHPTEEEDVGKESRIDDAKSACTTPRRRVRRVSDAQEDIEKFIATVSPPASPPSTARRRKGFRRLILTDSSEEDGQVLGPGLASADEGNINRRRQSRGRNSSTLDYPKGEEDKVEWYHERGIEDFSESSSDGLKVMKEGESSFAKVKLSLPPRMRRRLTFSDVNEEHDCNPIEKEKNVDIKDAQDSNSTASQGQMGKARTGNDVDETRSPKDYEAPSQVIDLINEDDVDFSLGSPPDACRPSAGDCSKSNVGSDTNRVVEDIDEAPPFHLIALCKDGESILQMKGRVGEEYVMRKIVEAQESGRRVLGGEELGLTSSYNKNVFNRFSETVVAGEVGKQRTSTSVTEQALRGEFKFNYRGRNKASDRGKRAVRTRRYKSTK